MKEWSSIALDAFLLRACQKLILLAPWAVCCGLGGFGYLLWSSGLPRWTFIGFACMLGALYGLSFYWALRGRLLPLVLSSVLFDPTVRLLPACLFLSEQVSLSSAKWYFVTTLVTMFFATAGGMAWWHVRGGLAAIGLTEVEESDERGYGRKLLAGLLAMAPLALVLGSVGVVCLSWESFPSWPLLLLALLSGVFYLVVSYRAWERQLPFISGATLWSLLFISSGLFFLKEQPATADFLQALPLLLMAVLFGDSQAPCWIVKELQFLGIMLLAFFGLLWFLQTPLQRGLERKRCYEGR